jgi:hypothetical protein
MFLNDNLRCIRGLDQILFVIADTCKGEEDKNDTEHKFISKANTRMLHDWLILEDGLSSIF